MTDAEGLRNSQAVLAPDSQSAKFNVIKPV